MALTPTPSSDFQLTRPWPSGTFDIAMTAFDNVVAYQEGQGEAKIPPNPDMFAFMGSDNGFLSVVGGRDIKGFADLKGKKLSVDALTTGYAFVLRELLQTGGPEAGRVLAGPRRRRPPALGRAAGARRTPAASSLDPAPSEVLAEAAGFRRLGNAVDALGRYQGLVGAARRSWARENPAKLVGYIRAYRAGLGLALRSGQPGGGAPDPPEERAGDDAPGPGWQDLPRCCWRRSEASTVPPRSTWRAPAPC